LGKIILKGENMDISKILVSKQISPLKDILQITTEEALCSLKKALKEFSLSVDFNMLSKEELEKLLSDYADAVVTYHHENYHQERATFLRNEKILKKYGLTDEDFIMIDFT
jgi:hypothetical protein